MPLYEYRCASCGELTEVLQRLGAEPLTECPRCGGALERVVSAPALQFKGSGWYVTDYARRGGNGAPKKEETGAATKPEAAPAKPESTPASEGTKKEGSAKAE